MSYFPTLVIKRLYSHWYWKTWWRPLNLSISSDYVYDSPPPNTYAKYLAPWCSGYHYCTYSFIKTWTHVLRRFKSCLTMAPAGNKVKRLSSGNHTTKTIHHHHHHQHHHHHHHQFIIIFKNYTSFVHLMFQ